MERDILIQNLRTRVGEDNCKSISDKTFEGIADVYLPMFADDSAITDETWKFPVAALNEFAGQKRHDEKAFAEKFKADYAKQYDEQHKKDVEDRIAKAVEKAIEEYKSQHPDKKTGEDGSKEPENLDERIGNAVANALAKLTGEEGEIGKLSKTVTDFMKSQADREKTEAKNRVKTQLRKHLIDLKANNEACVDDALGDLEYGEKPTFDELKQSAIDAYEKRYKRYYGDGGKPFGGDSGGTGGSTDFVKERIEKLKEENKRNANYAAEISKNFK